MKKERKYVENSFMSAEKKCVARFVAKRFPFSYNTLYLVAAKAMPAHWRMFLKNHISRKVPTERVELHRNSFTAQPIQVFWYWKIETFEAIDL